MKKVKSKSLPNTPTQKWLRSMSACEAGRREVADQTLSQWFNTTRRTDWMRWVISHLLRGEHGITQVIIPDDRKLGVRQWRQWAIDNNVKLPLGV